MLVLTEPGVATWSLEYRRIGNPGGGWLLRWCCAGPRSFTGAGADLSARPQSGHCNWPLRRGHLAQCLARGVGAAPPVAYMAKAVAGP